MIALIEDRPGRYHYVVVVAAPENGPIVHHDPARAPSRALDASAFDARWAKAERWMLVLHPPASLSDPKTPPSRDSQIRHRRPRAVPGADGRWDGEGEARPILLERGHAFEAAAAACPESGAPWRELAGLAALDKDWDTAARHARRALDADGDDEHARRVLATAEFVRHRDLEALAAWNALGEPRVDLVDIKGLEHTRYMVVADAIGVRPRELLTPGALRIAQQRVRDLPGVSAARVTFRPVENGTRTSGRHGRRTSARAARIPGMDRHGAERRREPRDRRVVRERHRRRRCDRRGLALVAEPPADRRVLFRAGPGRHLDHRRVP